MGDIRLQKFLSDAGVASRRKAEEYIKEGRISVNGITITELGTRVREDDQVCMDGKRVALALRKVYIMLNKPEGYVTTAKDQFSRKTVLDLIHGIDERIYPVGRLDYDTSGLLLLTNDGDFTYKMTHPAHLVNKVYSAVVKGNISNDTVKKLERGLEIEGYKTAPAEVRIVGTEKSVSLIEITIHEGRNRQVRKMCEAVGHPVVKLRRVAIGGLIMGELPEGKWRYLTDEEVRYLNSL